METIGRLWRSWSAASSFKLGLRIFLIALVVRLAFMVVFHPYRDLTRFELERTALSLAQTGVYGNPYAAPTGPTAHVSPGYTLILAGLFRVFGTGIPAEIVKELLASSVSSLVCALLPAAARVLGIDVRAGILAGLASALYPATPLVQIDGDWEAPYTALALIFVAMLTVRLWTEQRLSGRTALLHGLVWGVALLFVSALLTMFVVFVIAGVYFCREAGLRKYLAFAGLEVLVVALCLAPWAIRNDRALGSPILTRSNLGLELRVSNNDLASPDQHINSIDGVYDKYHPLQNVGEAIKVRQLGEVAYNQQAGEQAKEWIRTHPIRFLELCLGRVRCFWLYQDPTSPMKTLFLNATVLLGLAGLVGIFRAAPVTGVVAMLILLIYPLPNYLIQVGLRQEYPIEWLMTLLTGALIVQWADDDAIPEQPLFLLASVRGSPRDTPAPCSTPIDYRGCVCWR